MNILYIHSHDTGRGIQPYSPHVATPNLQRLADQGVLFRQAFCTSPTCSPGRAGLLTGQYPHQCGQWGLSNLGYPLEHPERHWVTTLKKAGYHTALLGVQHVAADELDLGYDEVREDTIGGAQGVRDPELCANQVGPAAEAWLREHAGDDAPWFLDAGTIQTHCASWRRLGPHERPTQHQIDRAQPASGMPNTPEAREWQALHQAVARQLDDGMGRILSALEETGQADNTLVIYTTDHGMGLPMHKSSLHDGGLEVSLIIRAPGDFIGGKTIHAPVSHLDVFPTLCDLCGIPEPAWLEGKSLRPLVRGKVERYHDALFGEINVHGHPQPERTVRTERYRLIRKWFIDDERPYDNTDKKAVINQLHDAGWPQCMGPGRPVESGVSDYLYDLYLDPQQRCDRAGDPAYTEVYAELAAKIETWMIETRDPVLTKGVDGIPQAKPYVRPSLAERQR